jgi:hypothetical protein
VQAILAVYRALVMKLNPLAAKRMKSIKVVVTMQPPVKDFLNSFFKNFGKPGLNEHAQG